MAKMAGYSPGPLRPGAMRRLIGWLERRPAPPRRLRSRPLGQSDLSDHLLRDIGLQR